MKKKSMTFVNTRTQKWKKKKKKKKKIVRFLNERLEFNKKQKEKKERKCAIELLYCEFFSRIFPTSSFHLCCLRNGLQRIRKSV